MTAVATASAAAPATVGGAAHALAGKYLTFALASEEYGLPVLTVREIIKVMDVTPVPHAPAHVKGVINLRGKVIPVVDIRLKFGLEARPYDDRTCIIVIGVTVRGAKLMIGIVVDAVSEVLNVASDEIEETPDFGERINTEFIQGVAKVKGRVMFLLDLDQVLAGDAAVGR